jgi:hypothetical protein
MDVEQLIEVLQKLIKEYPETKNYQIRVIEETDYDEEGTPKANYWLDYPEGFDVSYKGQSGYELHGEVRLTGRL